MAKKMNADKPVVDAIVVKPVVKLSLPEPKKPAPQRVSFEYEEAKGWRVYVTGTDDPHEAVHMLMAVCETTNGIIPVCLMYDAKRQPDGSWGIGLAHPDELLAKLIKRAESKGN